MEPTPKPPDAKPSQPPSASDSNKKPNEAALTPLSTLGGLLRPILAVFDVVRGHPLAVAVMVVLLALLVFAAAPILQLSQQQGLAGSGAVLGLGAVVWAISKAPLIVQQIAGSLMVLALVVFAVFVLALVAPSVANAINESLSGGKGESKKVAPPPMVKPDSAPSTKQDPKPDIIKTGEATIDPMKTAEPVLDLPARKEDPDNDLVTNEHGTGGEAARATKGGPTRVK